MPKKVSNKPKKVSKKKVVVSAPTPVEPAPVEPAPVESTSVESTSVEFDYANEISELQGELKNALNIIKGLVTHVSKLEKKISRDRKMIEKKLKSRPRRVSNGLNGFSKPGPVSDELRNFLSLGKEDLIARTEVTKKITTYCQEKGLQKESDKRVILQDKALTKLLHLPKGENLTYFNLQKYMKIHFPNKEGVYPTL